jgi:hypothetical protein
MLMTMIIQFSIIVLVIFIVIDDRWGLAMTCNRVPSGAITSVDGEAVVLGVTVPCVIRLAIKIHARTRAEVMQRAVKIQHHGLIALLSTLSMVRRRTFCVT